MEKRGVSIVTELSLRDTGKLMNCAKSMDMTVGETVECMIRHCLLFVIDRDKTKKLRIEK